VPSTPARPLRALDPEAFAVLAAVADRLCPGGEGLPKARELEVAEKVDALLAAMDPAMVADVQVVLSLIENALAGLLFEGRWTTFTAALPEAQDRILEAWRSSRVYARRSAFKAVHGLVTAAYWGSPEVHARVGYPGPPTFVVPP
jgi:hypothetical protein